MTEKILQHTVDVGNIQPSTLELMVSILKDLGINFFLEQAEDKLTYDATTTQRKEIEKELRSHASTAVRPNPINTSAFI